MKSFRYLKKLNTASPTKILWAKQLLRKGVLSIKSRTFQQNKLSLILEWYRTFYLICTYTSLNQNSWGKLEYLTSSSSLTFHVFLKQTYVKHAVAQSSLFCIAVHRSTALMSISLHSSKQASEYTRHASFVRPRSWNLSLIQLKSSIRTQQTKQRRK